MFLLNWRFLYGTPNGDFKCLLPTNLMIQMLAPNKLQQQHTHSDLDRRSHFVAQGDGAEHTY
jgi:hypothetical protein